MDESTWQRAGAMTDLTTDVTVTIHGTDMDLIAEGKMICPAEPDVGIMRAYIEDWDLHFADGTPIPLGMYGILPQGEFDKVEEALNDALDRGDFWPDPEEAK